MYTEEELLDILTDYSKKIEKFKQYKDPLYVIYGLKTEFWEFMDKAYIKPVLRGDKEYNEDELKLEMGDCLWMIVAEAYGQFSTLIPILSKPGLKESPKSILYNDLNNPRQYEGAVGLLLNYYGWDLKEILDMNIAKLEGRLAKGTLKGGDRSDERS